MKISVDGIDLLELNETQKSVIKDYLDEDVFEEDMRRRIRWVIMHLYEESFRKLKSEWDQRLIDNNVSMVPTNPDEYAQLVFSQPNYLSRKQRDSLGNILPL